MRRAQLELTQQELAGRMGTTKSVISRIESGQHRATTDTLRQLAEALDGHAVIGFEFDSEQPLQPESCASPGSIDAGSLSTMPVTMWPPSRRFPRLNAARITFAISCVSSRRPGPFNSMWRCSYPRPDILEFGGLSAPVHTVRATDASSLV
ncbi:MAG: helix-turn-helix domain-containing protein [Acidimicrobiales bacterium]